jgi:HAD superfamily hydrolase (TIGR01509 family)
MDLNSRIRAVIFDMDGVLVDSEPLINAAAIAMFKEKGLNVRPEDFLPFVGAGEDRYIGGVAEKYNFPLDIPAAKKRTYEIYLDLVPARLQTFPGAVEFVHSCREAGLMVAIASSADKIKVQANLQKIGLPVEFWDAVIWGEDVQKKKPAPDIFLLAAEKMSIDPNWCVVVEDAVNGIQAAHAAGMRCVALATTFPREKLQDADTVRESIADIGISDVL